MRILLVEKDPVSGETLRALLAREGYDVEWLTPEEAVVTTLCIESFSLAILDLDLQESIGLAVLRDIRAQSQVPVMILTARDAVEQRVEGLDAGAGDYMLKPFDSQELLVRIEVLARRARNLIGQSLSIGQLIIDEVEHLVSWRGKPVHLSPCEFSLLLKLARHRDTVLPRSALEAVLHDGEEEVGSNVLEVLVHHLRRKLDKRLIVTVRGAGYRLDSRAT